MSYNNANLLADLSDEYTPAWKRIDFMRALPGCRGYKNDAEIIQVTDTRVFVKVWVMDEEGNHLASAIADAPLFEQNDQGNPYPAANPSGAATTIAFGKCLAYLAIGPDGSSKQTVEEVYAYVQSRQVEVRRFVMEGKDRQAEEYIKKEPDESVRKVLTKYLARLVSAKANSTVSPNI